MADQKLTNEEKVTILQKNLESTKISLSDLNVEKFGSNRRSEIKGVIGDTGQTFDETYDNYLLSL